MLEIATHVVDGTSASTVMNIVILQQCLRLGIPPRANSLHTLPYASHQRVDAMRAAGWRSIANAVEADDEELWSVVLERLQLSNEAQIDTWIQFVRALPKTRMSCELQRINEGKQHKSSAKLNPPFVVSRGCGLELNISVSTINRPTKYALPPPIETQDFQTFSSFDPAEYNRSGGNIR
jgi:hypothetical protein